MKAFIIDPEGCGIHPFAWDQSIAAMEAATCARNGMDFCRINAANDRVAVDDRGKIDGSDGA